MLANHLLELRGTGRLRFVLPTRGTALRTVITGTKVIGSASYASGKNKRTLGVESHTEHMAAMYHEVAVGTVKSWVQICRIDLITSTGTISHIPDAARLTADGYWEIIDYKRDWRQFDSGEGQQQTALGQMAADTLGVSYVRNVLASLGSERFLENVEMVQVYRFKHVSVREEHAASAFIAEHGPVSLGQLADALHEDQANGFATVCALMVRRRVEIDLSGRLDRNSRVSVVPTGATHHDDLFAPLRAAASIEA